MEELARDDYTSEEIRDMLHGKNGSRVVKFRYDLLDKDERKKGELKRVHSGEVSMNAFNTIKRTAKFTIEDEYVDTRTYYTWQNAGDMVWNELGGSAYRELFTIDKASAQKIDWLNDRVQPFALFQMPSEKVTRTVGYEDITGRNLLTDTETSLVGIRQGKTFELVTPDKKFTAIFQNKKFKIGSYIFSIWLKRGVDDLASSVRFHKNGVTVSYEKRGTGNVEWERIDIKFKVTSESDYYGVQIYNHNFGEYFATTMTVKQPKIELSSEVTPWVPSAEDAGGEDAYKENYMESITEEYWEEKWIEFPLGVFLLSSPEKKDSNGYIVREVEAYDGLIILDQDKFTERTYFPAGALYADVVRSIIVGAGIKKINMQIPAGLKLSNDKEYATGDSKLSAINDLLDAVNNTPLWVDASGYFRSQLYERPDDKAVGYTYSDQELSIIVEGVEEELDLFDIPNSWIVTVSNPEEDPLVARKDNTNPDSPTSIPSRDRRIVDFREIDDISNQKALDAYVERIASEASQVYGRIKFSTPLMPHHEYYDVIGFNFEPLGIAGKFAEVNWTMKLQAGEYMTHEVRKVVSID